MWLGHLVTKSLVLLISGLICSSSLAQTAGGTFFKRRLPPLNFSTVPQTVFAGNCSGVTTVQTPANVLGAPLIVNLTSSGSVSFFSDRACTVPITSVTIAIGTNSSSFYYSESVVSSPTITAYATAYANANQVTTVQTNPFIWTGGGGNALWSTGLNWSGGVAPSTTSHVAVFNSSCVSNCSPNISTAINISGIRMEAGYNGTITQGSGVSITLNTAGWVMRSGTFQGSDSTVEVRSNAGLHLLGGTFNSTTGFLRINPPTDTNSKMFIMASSGATFNHGNGTLEFVNNTSPCSSTFYEIDLVNNLNLNNLRFSSNSSGCGTAQYLNFNPANTINVLGTLTDWGAYQSIGGGTFNLYGNYISNTTTQFGGTATYIFVGTANQTYTAPNSGADYSSPHVKINKPLAGTVTPTNSNSIGFMTFEIIAGNFTAPSGILFIGRGQLEYFDVFKIPSGTTFNHNNGKVAFVGTIATCSSYTYNIDVPNNFTFYDLAFERKGGSGCGASQLFNIMNGSTVRVLRNLDQNFGRLSGAIEFSGNYSVSGTTGNGGTALLRAVGSGTQIFTSTGSDIPSGTLTIAQTGSGKVILASAWNYGGRNWNLVSGKIYMSGFNLTLQGLTLNGNTIYKKNDAGAGSAGVLTVGGSAISNGAFLGGTVSD